LDEKELQPIEHRNQRILTTAQIAEFYGTTSKIISQNFTRHKKQYAEGEDYFCLEGGAKQQLISNHPQIEDGSKRASKLYLWTEYGALMHAKTLNTDEAWKVFRKLRQSYFQVVQHQKLPLINSLWEQRLELFHKHTKIPDGYWCIFGMVAAYCRSDEFRNVHLVENALPDGSVGKHWCEFLREQGYDTSTLKKYPHRFPDKRGVQMANIYSNELLGVFWTWFNASYLKKNYPLYLKGRLASDGMLQIHSSDRTNA
jgi:hypothetical protein